MAGRLSLTSTAQRERSSSTYPRPLLIQFPNRDRARPSSREVPFEIEGPEEDLALDCLGLGLKENSKSPLADGTPRLTRAIWPYNAVEGCADTGAASLPMVRDHNAIRPRDS